jgi:lysozyme
MIDKLIIFLKKHEGVRLFPYTDTVGKLTIGVGRNLTDNGISGDEAEYMFKNDIDRVINDLNIHLPWYKNLSENRQIVLIDMCFNIGIFRLLGFKKTLAFMELGDYENAAVEMLASKWAGQVGMRAVELVDMMREG